MLKSLLTTTALVALLAGGSAVAQTQSGTEAAPSPATGGEAQMNNDAATSLPETFEPSHFFDPLHRTIFDAILAGSKSGKVINPYSVKSFIPASLADVSIEGMSVSQYLARLASSTAGWRS